jgi:hypothetical protein
MAHVYTLRLKYVPVSPGQHQVEVTLEKDGQPVLKAVSPLSFALSSQDQEDMRWYLEDYLQYPLDPTPTVAERIERRMAEIGKELFRGIFQQNDDAKSLWAAALPRLNDTRVEIVAEVREATTIPWELIRDPKTDVLLALRVPSFVRASAQTEQAPHRHRARPAHSSLAGHLPPPWGR